MVHIKVYGPDDPIPEINPQAYIDHLIEESLNNQVRHELNVQRFIHEFEVIMCKQQKRDFEDDIRRAWRECLKRTDFSFPPPHFRKTVTWEHIKEQLLRGDSTWPSTSTN